MHDWSIWLIYFGWLLFIGCLVFFAYRKVNNHSTMLSFAWALFYCAAASVTLLIIFLILCASDKFKNFVYKQVCYNGNEALLLQLSQYTWQNSCCVGG